MQTHEREITKPVDLCDARGRLDPSAAGWSRRPLHRCNLRGHPLRKKKWNYWAITSDRCLFSATVSSVDYAGLAFVYFLDFETGRYHEKTVTVPFGRGFTLPETADGDASYFDRRINVLLAGEGGDTRIRVECPDFGGVSLTAEVLVTRPASHETLNVVIPWSGDRFQFTSKQNTLPVSGEVRLGGDTYAFEAKSSFGCLDYGRGVWRYRCFWNWGAGSGVAGGRTVGLNLGGGWTDGTGMTENGVCVDGRLSKIGEDLEWRYDTRDYMKPWAVRTPGSDRVDLRFVPFFERVARSNLVLVRSEVHQTFGRYSGTVVTDAGETVGVDGVIGWVEHHRARW
jgi:hypothetical protein